MKKTRLLSVLLLALLLIAAGCAAGGTQEVYEQSTEPFSQQDVADILQGLETVGDYVNAMDPTNYSWFFIGEATGETQLTLNNPDGRIAIRFKTPDGTIGGLVEGESEQLPAEILELKAIAVSIEWLNEYFSAIPTIRGIEVGAPEEKVLSGFLRNGDGDVMYTIEDINKEADESWIADWAFVGGKLVPKGGSGGFYEWDTLVYGWCALTGPEEWKEYYKLEYQLDGDAVRSIRLEIQGDELDE